MADTSPRRRILQCPRCGAENLPTNRFCAQCGANLRGETPAAAATTMTPKAGTVMPYSPGAQGPGRVAWLVIIFTIFVLIACSVLFWLFLSSGADRTPPRPTIVPTRQALVVPYQQ